MNELVTLEQAKQRLRITVNLEDDDLRLMMIAAQSQVLELIRGNKIADAEAWAATVDGWTDETVPAHVAHAILLQFGALTRARGDDDHGVAPQFDEDGFANGVKGMLRRLYDSALA